MRKGREQGKNALLRLAIYAPREKTFEAHMKKGRGHLRPENVHLFHVDPAFRGRWWECFYLLWSAF